MYIYIYIYTYLGCFHAIFRLPSFVFVSWGHYPMVHLDPLEPGQISNRAWDSHDTIPLGTSQVAATWPQERRTVIKTYKNMRKNVMIQFSP